MTIVVCIFLTLLLAPIMFVYSAFSVVAGSAEKIGSGEKTQHFGEIRWGDEITDEHDGIETARQMFGVEIVGGKYKTVDRYEFDKMQAKNHRADPGATSAEDVFPPGDRPRGEDDISAVNYFMTAVNVNPIMVLHYNGEKYVIDGVHRLVAAYLMHSPIKYREYFVDNMDSVPSAAAQIGSGEEKPLSREEALNLEYPYRRLFMTDLQLHRAFENVKKYQLKLVHADYKIRNMPGLNDNQLYFNGKKTICEMSPRDYYTMNWMSDWFNEKCRLACKRHDEVCAPLDDWSVSGESFYRDIEMSGQQPTAQLLNDAVYNKVIGCNNFRPGIMSGMIKKFNAKSVLDFSAGWGDRLIGAISQGVRYVGVDPNPCVHIGYADIIKTFARDPSKYTMILAPFQSAELPTVGSAPETFDLVLTSPPYFNLEIYSDTAGQSVAEFSDLGDWFDGFLMASLKKAWRVINNGGHMVIVINNIRNKDDFVMKMVENVNNFVGAKYLGVISYADKIERGGRSHYKSPQPMWIWEKGEIGNQKPNTTIDELTERWVNGLANVADDPQIMENIAAGSVWSRGKIEELIEYANADKQLPCKERKYFHWVILLDDKVIGYIGLYPLEKNSPLLQLRIFIARSEHGKGYGKESIRRALAAYRKLVGCEENISVYMQMKPSNVASAKLAESVGFKELRGEFFADSRRSAPVRRFVLSLGAC